MRGEEKAIDLNGKWGELKTVKTIFSHKDPNVKYSQETTIFLLLVVLNNNMARTMLCATSHEKCIYSILAYKEFVA